MARYAMVTDLRKCVGCHACTVACNSEWSVPPGQARTHVRETPLSGVFPKLSASVFVSQCNHCDRAPCVDACPSGASYHADDGRVMVDEGLCVGCGFCTDACPYEARFIHAQTRKVDKCDFCERRVARGEQPACVATCTTGAKTFGDLEARDSEVFSLVYEQGARRIEGPLAAVGPNVYYLGKPEQLALVEKSFPPRAARLPRAGEVWRRLAKPLVLTAVAATFLGQAVAFFNQLATGEKDIED